MGLAALAVPAQIAWAQTAVAPKTSDKQSAPSSKSDKKDRSPAQWMDEWIARWKADSKEVAGVLYLGRFADPVYFLTKEIKWKPNADQDRKLPSVTVPVGFVTDFASIPRAFWSLLRPDGSYAYAAVIHDYLYWTQTTSRETSDLILKLAMADFKIDGVDAGAIYKGVRLGGAGPWKDNANLKTRGERRILKTPPTDPRTLWTDYKKHAEFFVK